MDTMVKKNRKFVIIGVIGILLLGAYIAYAGVVVSRYMLISTDPEANDTGIVIDPAVTLDFKGKTPDSKIVTVTSVPKETWKVEKPTKTMLMFSPKNKLKENVRYTLTIAIKKGMIVPPKGSPSKTFLLSFTTGDGLREENTATPDDYKPLTQAEKDAITDVAKYAATNWNSINNVASSKVNMYSQWFTKDYLAIMKEAQMNVEYINRNFPAKTTSYPPIKLGKIQTEFDDPYYPKVTIVTDEATFIFSFAKEGKEGAWKINDVDFKDLKTKE